VTTEQLVPLSEAAAAHNLRTQLLHHWVRSRRLPVVKVGAYGRGLVQCRVRLDRVAELAAEYRAKKERKATTLPKRANERVARPGLERDGDAPESPIDAVAATFEYGADMLTAWDRAVLAQRRERFEARRAGAVSRVA
jgi:hypothetical protein